MCAIYGRTTPHLHAARAIYSPKYSERLVPETYYAPPGIRDTSAFASNQPGSGTPPIQAGLKAGWG